MNGSIDMTIDVVPEAVVEVRKYAPRICVCEVVVSSSEPAVAVV